MGWAPMFSRQRGAVDSGGGCMPETCFEVCPNVDAGSDTRFVAGSALLTFARGHRTGASHRDTNYDPIWSSARSTPHSQ